MDTGTKQKVAALDRWAWRCQECGHKFKTVKAAERAAFGDRGCPKCGGSDIDMSLPVNRVDHA